MNFKPRRITIEIRRVRDERRWVAFENLGWLRGWKRIDESVTKAPLVKRVAAKCVAGRAATGQLYELAIKGEFGRIQDKRTYGLDPRRSKG